MRNNRFVDRSYASKPIVFNRYESLGRFSLQSKAKMAVIMIYMKNYNIC